MNTEEGKSVLAKALMGIVPFSLSFFDALKKYRKISNNQLFIEFIILDYHAIIERNINDVLAAYISQDNLKSKNEVHEYFTEKQPFGNKLKWMKRCRLLDIDDKQQQRIFTILEDFNTVRNSIAHRNYHIKGACKYNDKDVFIEATFEKLIIDLQECNEYLEEKLRTLLRGIAIQHLFAMHSAKAISNSP